MNSATRKMLADYADRFETPVFLHGDPSWFMHQVEGTLNRETMAFVAAALSFGLRKQFMPKIQTLLDAAQGCPFEWVATGAFEAAIPHDDACFYRFYSNSTMLHFLRALRRLMEEYGSLGDFASHAIRAEKAGQGDALKVLVGLARFFRSQGLVGIVPPPLTSVCKRPCMFLRWMVRDESPVDLGVWADRIDKASLYIPVDTHVVQTAQRLGLVKAKSVSWSTVVLLSQKMSRVFHGDPARGDYALYGADVLRDNPAFAE